MLFLYDASGSLVRLAVRIVGREKEKKGGVRKGGRAFKKGACNKKRDRRSKIFSIHAANKPIIFLASVVGLRVQIRKTPTIHEHET